MKAGVLVLKGLMVAALATFLCSCGGSDDNGNGNGNSGSASVVGNWNLVSATSAGVTITAQQMGATTVLHVNADGTYSAVTTSEAGTDTENGTWSVNGNAITFSAEGAPQNAPYTVSESTFTLTYTQGGQSVTMTFTRL